MNESGLDVYAHRAEWQEGGEENNVNLAKEALARVDGVEVDVGFTKDGVAVVTHDNASELSFEEFKKKYPEHATLESWIEWFREEEMVDLKKKIYLDLKGTAQDPYRLMQLVDGLGERVAIGSKDPRTVARLLLAREILDDGADGDQPKVYLQIPDPVLPRKALDYVDNLWENVGLREEGGIIKDKPDGVHFYWPENLAKEIVAELCGHGEFLTVIDKLKVTGSELVRKLKDVEDWRSLISELGSFNEFRQLVGDLGKKLLSPKIVPNIPILHDLQRRRLWRFTQEAISRGYEVIAGSTASPITMERMIDWGVKAVMPNVTREEMLPRQVQNGGKSIELKGPEDQFRNTRKLFEGDLKEELEKKGLEEKREVYLRCAVKMKTVGVVRQQIGL